MQSIYLPLLDAYEKFNFALAHRLAEVMDLKYNWSDGPIVTQDEMEVMASVLMANADRCFRENAEKGNPKRSISVASGGFTVTANWWESEKPQIKIHFGINSVVE